MQTTTSAGTVVHVATDLRYVGRFTVESVDTPAGTAIITDGRSRGRAALDQLFATKTEALSAVKAMSSGSLAELGGNRVARRARR